MEAVVVDIGVGCCDVRKIVGAEIQGKQGRWRRLLGVRRQNIPRQNGTGKFGLPKIAIALLVAHTSTAPNQRTHFFAGKCPM